MRIKEILKDDIVFYNALALHKKTEGKYVDITERDLETARDGYLTVFNKKFEIMALLMELGVVKIGSRVEDLF